MSNFSLVVPASYSPFTMQEMLAPWSMYKQEYDKLEEQSIALQEKADAFKYLSDNLPEDSKAKQIYDGYANDLSRYADDILKRGVNMSNQRGMTQMRRRYSGEIGRLEKADEALRKEQELRRQMSTKDSSMLYATDNLSIDNFLDRNTPNLYNISGNELYSRGAATGKAASSRIYSVGDQGSTLGGYYKDWVERNGYNENSMLAFRENAANIPELQMQAEAILQERGVNDNLTGVARERARQAVINGMIDGAVYQEKHNPVRDPGVMDAYQNAQVQHQTWAETRQEREDSKDDWKYTWDKDGRATGYSPAYIKALSAAGGEKNGNSSGTTSKNGSTSKEYHSGLKDTMIIERKGKVGQDAKYNSHIVTDKQEESDFDGEIYTYDKLSPYWKKEVQKAIPDDLPSKYIYIYEGEPGEDGRLMIKPNQRTKEEDNSLQEIENYDPNAGLE